MNVTKTGKWGIALVTASLCAFVAQLEGTRHKVYLDVGGVPTVCQGYTGPEVKLGDTWTTEQCATAFSKALASHGAGVLRCMTKQPTQIQYEAWASFTYNVGIGAACGSTAMKLWNAGDVVGACDQFRRWNLVDGKVWRGLVTRREAERVLCLG